MVRLFAVGDVGGPRHFHLGDEAMLEANLDAFRQISPGIQFTVMSQDPGWTAQRYGVDAVTFPQIPAGETADSVLRAMAERPGADDLWTGWLGEEVAGALRRSDGLLISGGGNLCASWPDKILERVALLVQARAFGIPAVITGQTLGPVLRVKECGLLERALQGAAWVGVREGGSAAQARSLGVATQRVHEHLDDAFFMEPVAVTDGRLPGGGKPWIVVTLDASFGHPLRRSCLRAIAQQLDALAESLQATLVFSPHVGGEEAGDSRSDAVAGRALEAELRSKLVRLELWEAKEVRWLIGEAAMVVSSRYHPLVFATAAGVPAVGLYGDAYTRRKVRGALAAAELEGFSISFEDAERGGLLPLALELWEQRAKAAERMGALARRPYEVERWGEIARALGLEARVRELGSGRAVPIWDEPRAAEPVISDAQWRQFEERGYLRLGHMDGNGLLARRVEFREACERQYGEHVSVSVLPITFTNESDELWRQEADFFRLDRNPLLTAWVGQGLSPGRICLMPGSHRRGLLSVEGLQQRYRDAAAETVEIAAGEVVLLHNWLLRRVVSGKCSRICYMDGRTLDTETGRRFPVVFAAWSQAGRDDAEAALPFVRALLQEHTELRLMVDESQIYAQSLLEDNRRRELMRADAERYAWSLEAELGRREHGGTTTAAS